MTMIHSIKRLGRALLRRRLPENTHVSTSTIIRNMEVNTMGYIFAWAQFIRDGRLYVNGEYTVHPAPEGDLMVRIRRDGRGYHIDNPKGIRPPSWKSGDVPSAIAIDSHDMLIDPTAGTVATGEPAICSYK